MFFKKRREKMRAKSEKQNDAFLEDTLIPDEKVTFKMTSVASAGQLAREIIAVTNKRLIIINVDKAVKPHITSLKFNDIVEVNNNVGPLKMGSVVIITAQRQIPTSIYRNETIKEFLNALEAKRLE